MKKVLITGGAGFIGSNLTEELLKKGCEVHILDILDEPEKISSFKDRVNYVKADVRDKDIHKILNDINPDGIVHLAAVSRVIWCQENPELCNSVNLGGTKNILEAISNMKEKPWFIFGSSREVYGNPKIFPVSESAPLSAINIYATTKIYGENMVREFSSKYGITRVIFRLSNVYGNERDIFNRVIPKFILNALTDQEITIYGKDKFFDFTFIDDTVNAFVNAIERMSSNEYDGAETYNICTGTPTRLEEVPELISRYIEKDMGVRFVESREYEVEGYYGTYEKARRDLDFEPRWRFEDGLKYTIDRLKIHIGVILG